MNLTKSSVIPHVSMGKLDIETVPRDHFSLCYAGSVLPPREVNILFKGVKRFRELLNSENSFRVRFLVDKPEIVAASAKSMGIEDVIDIEDAVPYSQMPKSLAQSDILIIIEAPLQEGIFMASKIVDYIQIGRPILALAPPVGTIVDLFSKYGGGIAVDCQSVDAVVQALQTLYAHWKSASLNQTFSTDALLELFSEDNVLDQYGDLIEKLKTES
jgi:hypothetical protein